MKPSGEYPIDWEMIAWNVKAEAGWHCEHCGHVNDKTTHHVLTVHHLNGRKSDCEYENLVALCQRCHLRIQAKYDPEQMWLWLAPVWALIRGLVVV